MSINFKELRELLGAIAQTDISEVILKTEAFELKVRRELKTVTSTIPISSEVINTNTSITSTDSVQTTPTTSSNYDNWIPITSPMVGIFYSASAPEEPPFVEVGDHVSKTQTVCIIEAMKLMNEIEVEMAGEIMEIMVKNGEPVEYGQTLIWVNPK
ncbi:acetyl-CoA carboxylase biotin carboxyl carrier protein [Candidatus Atelocyanobacterium thalassae]|uniref:Biotin carboxyl carrier protein of acetyl-CoA carboxylase n=2 Tax=Candidatus Atelocyanobacterium thalassae TaxID=713887 RepID=A0A086CHQ0_9CHRO|nr:acetyl-CoA carboxylase biotin carboxyl carrier protein [Candidatus Atelocyanobacterium thalassa]KFF41714.1 MAG: biotin carboxyl carrier protein [Candidatus Atelocyanobacterium thalassa isolate SIO64986]BDA39490.1 biotin carboxyl carrier protein of acetyl-CoA carboxylase [cyanobacterium endosymbiont of Braarudosphaera bigelowii]